MSERLYHQLAHLWPLISPLEDYAAEAERVGELIERFKSVDASEPLHVVELGAGGGHTLFYFASRYRCTAIDLSNDMLENSRRINPDVTHRVADMRDCQFDEPCDVVLIHDAIEYLKTKADVEATFANAARNLKPNGLLIVATSYLGETFIDGDSLEDETGDDETEIRYVTTVEAVPENANQLSMNLTFFIRDIATETMSVETDRHICGLFSRADWETMLLDAGFAIAKHASISDGDDDGVGNDSDDAETAEDADPVPMFVGVKQ